MQMSNVPPAKPTTTGLPAACWDTESHRAGCFGELSLLYDKKGKAPEPEAFQSILHAPFPYLMNDFNLIKTSSGSVMAGGDSVRNPLHY